MMLRLPPLLVRDHHMELGAEDRGLDGPGLHPHSLQGIHDLAAVDATLRGAAR